MYIQKLFFIIISLFISLFAQSQMSLPDVLSDNMVLQQNSQVKLWGKATPHSTVEVITGWSKEKTGVKADGNGLWEIKVKTIEAGYTPYTITISNNNETKKLNNILLGEVWICAGQSNMSMPVKGFNSQPVNNALETITASEKYNQIRMFTAERKISDKKEFNVKGNWQMASVSTTPNFSAVGYYYALELHKILKVPVGMINLSWGGSNVQAWMSLENLKMFPEFNASQIDMNSKSPMRIPTALYNGMFYPVAKYGIKGAVWYQGESNVKEPELYSRMFPAMVKEWREKTGSANMPFYFVQIAPYEYAGSNKMEGALLREAQMKCSYSIPNSGMAVIMDIGDEHLIHPAEKAAVGQRLSLLALAKTYGFKELPHLFPRYDGMKPAGNKIVIAFENTYNGFLPVSELTGFEVAGDDNKFYAAKAALSKEVNKIEVWADEVSAPKQVRYCFKNYAEGNLKNIYGIPAPSFRTDKLIIE